MDVFRTRSFWTITATLVIGGSLALAYTIHNERRKKEMRAKHQLLSYEQCDINNTRSMEFLFSMKQIYDPSNQIHDFNMNIVGLKLSYYYVEIDGTKYRLWKYADTPNVYLATFNIEENTFKMIDITDMTTFNDHPIKIFFVFMCDIYDKDGHHVGVITD